MKEYIVKEDHMFVFPDIVGELIRCKDCYFYGTFQRTHVCTKYEHTVKKDGFCAWAEPKVTE